MANVSKVFISSILFIIVIVYSNNSIYGQDLNNSLTLKRTYQEYFDKALKLQSQGEFEQAIELYKNALAQAHKLKDAEKKCDCLLRIGLMNWNMGYMQDSKNIYQSALLIAHDNDFEDIISKVTDFLAIAELYAEGKNLTYSEYEKASDSFQKAINLARKNNSPEHELKCTRLQSNIYYDSGDYAQFKKLNEAALTIAQSLHHNKSIARCQNNIGLYYLQVTDYTKSLQHLDQALFTFKEIGSKADMSNCYDNMGIAYKNLGELDKALDVQTKALKIDKELGNKYYVANVLNNIGTTFRQKAILTEEKEYFNKALDYFNQSLQIINRPDSSAEILKILVYNNMGSVYSDTGEYALALDYFKAGYEKALEQNRIEYLGMILNNQGIVHTNQGNYSEATELFQQAIDLAQQISENKILWEAYLEIARALTNQDKKQEAVDSLKKSILIIENIRSTINIEELKASFLGAYKRIEAYHELIALLVDLSNNNPASGHLAEAFNYMERAKARTFLDRLKVSQIDITQNIDFRLKNQEKQIEKDVSDLISQVYSSGLSEVNREALKDTLTEKESELEALRRKIRSENPAYAALNYPDIIKLEEAQKNILDSKTVFFEYIIGKNKSFVFVITKNDIKSYTLPPKNILLPIVTEHLNNISDPENKDFKTGHNLYKILFPQDLNPKIKNIIFIPDDILHYLPFETLLMKESDNDWLINKYTISYAPSITSLHEIKIREKNTHSKQTKDLLAIGDPILTQSFVEDQTEIGELKYSGLEINNINKIFKYKKTTILSQDEATKNNLLKQNLADFKIIHFATHSRIDNLNPAHSYIILSPTEGSPDDIFLQTREIFNLKLNSDLVTLSACETGLGKLIKGEGIEGLNRAFFFAGTSSVLMSLWQVNDQATSQLMERFYSHLKSSKSITGSIRKTKLELIQDKTLSHPYYWAGFIVIGNADSNISKKYFTKWIIYGLLLTLLCVLIYQVMKKKISILNKKQRLN